MYRLRFLAAALVCLVSLSIPLSAQGNSLSARVRAFNNQLLVLHGRLLDNPGQSAAVRAEASGLIAQREAVLGQLVQEDAAEALKIAFPEDLAQEMRQSFPQSWARLESHGVWQAPIEYYIIDDPTMTVRKSVLRMTMAQENLEIYFGGSEPPGLRSGVILQVRGMRVGSSIAAAGGNVQGSVVAATSCSTLGDQKSVILLVRNPDVAIPASPTTTSMRDIFFAAAGRSVDQYWREVSYGRASTSGDVFGWFTLDQSYTCDQYSQMRTAAINAAAGAANFNNYTRVFLVFPTPSTGCGWAGLGTLGCSTLSAPSGSFTASTSWMLSGYFTSIDQGVKLATHEGGHNLSQHHASSRRFVAASGVNEMLGPLGAAGTLSEYGDLFSSMGSWNLGHYAAPHKAQINWLQGTEVTTVETNGSFSIPPLALNGRALKIRRGTGNNAWMWVEYRRPVGNYDTTLASQAFTGALIHYADSTTGTKTHLLDGTPETGSFSDPALPAGRTWVDPYSNVSLSITSADANALTLSVNYGPVPCTSQPPGVSISPGSASTSVGGSYTYTVTVTNGDTGPCPAKSFSVSSTSPSGPDWTRTLGTQSLLNVAPGTSAQTSLTIASGPAVSPGTYLVNASAQNSANATESGNSTANLSIRKPRGKSAASK